MLLKIFIVVSMVNFIMLCRMQRKYSQLVEEIYNRNRKQIDLCGSVYDLTGSIGFDTEETKKQIEEIEIRIASLEERIKDGKNYFVTNNVCDIDDIADVVAARLSVVRTFRGKPKI